MSDKPVSPPPPVTPVASVDEAQTSTVDAIEGLEATIARAASDFSEDERLQRVDDEWSTVESLRHITFVVDVWLSRAICGEEDPFHPIGLPPHFLPPKPPGMSVDPDARPTFEEACEVMRGRLATLNEYVAKLKPEELEREIANHAKTVGGGLHVIFTELNAHNLFINRDLDAIEAARGASA